ncbi:MAG: redoxin domain-containing protein [Gammaproteobacteria bacterium]|nr:redoxin domain-containing protein [Gammaproteobacteria bacterium]
MPNWIIVGSWLPRFVLVTAWLLLGTASILQAAPPLPHPAPPFTHHEPFNWINSKPLSLADLRGRVLLIDFWTFDCWNCYRSFPWLLSLEAQMKEQPFTVIGVHTPEFEHERDKQRLLEKIEVFQLRHPVMIDNDFSFWNAMGTRYWPTYYLIDKKGLVRNVFIGETRSDSAQAARITEAVEALLAEH